MSSWCLAAKDKRNFGGLLLQHLKGCQQCTEFRNQERNSNSLFNSFSWTSTLSSQNQQVKSHEDKHHYGGHKNSKLMQQNELEGQYNVLNPIQCNYVSKLGIGYPQTFWWDKAKEKKNHKPGFMWPLEKWLHYWVTFHLQIHSIPKM